MPPNTSTDSLDLIDLLRRRGGERYDGEGVSQLEHALQCADLARDAGHTDAVVVAALLHDIGHLLASDEAKGLDADDAARQGIDRRHEVVGANALREVFGEAVAAPVRLHVAAKRYLCATVPGYFEALSEASVISLKVQGGAFTDERAASFAELPHARDAIAVRQFDDRAKVPKLPTRPLSHYAAIVKSLA